ncbi:MAG: InlB B-repeat-containing protein [Bacteroidales bacterium]|nr:InlB B-repeat-containing protein [Bacteroidales bacterium]
MDKRSLVLKVALFLILTLAVGGCDLFDIKTYTVTFEPNGGTGTMPSQTFVDGVKKSLSPNEFTRENYNFSGWNTMSDNTGTSYADCEEISLTADVTLYAQWTYASSSSGSGGQSGGSGGSSGGSNPNPEPPTSHEWVDLGLPSGTLWATCNVGATRPEDYGKYFAWGETSQKSSYRWSTYQLSHSCDVNLLKYCPSSEFGYNDYEDELVTLEAVDDAATVCWGSEWRTPTKREIWELIENCTFSWTFSNGVKGGLFTGPNGRTIFLPGAGEFSDETCGAYSPFNGYYWSNHLYESWPPDAYYLKIDSDGPVRENAHRYYGMSIRPVRAQ